MSDYAKILHQIKLLQGQIASIDMSSKMISGWLPRKYVMKFFDIGDTTMATYEKTGNLIVSKIGNRKVYCVKSIVNLIESNILIK